MLATIALQYKWNLSDNFSRDMPICSSLSIYIKLGYGVIGREWKQLNTYINYLSRLVSQHVTLVSQEAGKCTDIFTAELSYFLSGVATNAMSVRCLQKLKHKNRIEGEHMISEGIYGKVVQHILQNETYRKEKDIFSSIAELTISKYKQIFWHQPPISEFVS